MMQAIELHPSRVGLRNVVDDANIRPESRHLWRYSELRDQSQNQHQVDEQMDGSKWLSASRSELAVNHRRDCEDHSTDQTHPVQDSERTVYDISG